MRARYQGSAISFFGLFLAIVARFYYVGNDNVFQHN